MKFASVAKCGVADVGVELKVLACTVVGACDNGVTALKSRFRRV